MRSAQGGGSCVSGPGGNGDDSAQVSRNFSLRRGPRLAPRLCGAVRRTSEEQDTHSGASRDKRHSGLLRHGRAASASELWCQGEPRDSWEGCD